jgi:hypothetical protein
MKTTFRILGFAGLAVLGLASCGDNNATPSGLYVGELEGAGIEMELDFADDGKAALTFIEGGNRLDDMDCTYESGENRIAVSCFGSSGISLTRLDNGDLEGDMDGAIVVFKKR